MILYVAQAVLLGSRSHWKAFEDHNYLVGLDSTGFRDDLDEGLTIQVGVNAYIC